MLASKSIFEAIFTIYCQLGNLQFNLQLSSEITQVTITMLVPDLHVYLYTQILAYKNRQKQKFISLYWLYIDFCFVKSIQFHKPPIDGATVYMIHISEGNDSIRCRRFKEIIVLNINNFSDKQIFLVFCFDTFCLLQSMVLLLVSIRLYIRIFI